MKIHLGFSILLNSVFFQSDVKLIKNGDKVGASEATLLNMLKISPFTYGLEIENGMKLLH